MTTFDKIAKQTKDLVTLSKNAKAVVKNVTTKNSRRKKQTDSKFAIPRVGNAVKPNLTKSTDILPKI